MKIMPTTGKLEVNRIGSNKWLSESFDAVLARGLSPSRGFRSGRAVSYLGMQAFHQWGSRFVMLRGLSQITDIDIDIRDDRNLAERLNALEGKIRQLMKLRDERYDRTNPSF